MMSSAYYLLRHKRARGTEFVYIEVRASVCVFLFDKIKRKRAFNQKYTPHTRAILFALRVHDTRNKSNLR